MPKTKKIEKSSSPKKAEDDDPSSRNDVQLMSYPALLERKRRIDERLEVITIPDVLKKRSKSSGGSGKRNAKSSPATSPKESGSTFTEEEIPFIPKTDTHWDFVIKGENI